MVGKCLSMGGGNEEGRKWEETGRLVQGKTWFIRMEYAQDT